MEIQAEVLILYIYIYIHIYINRVRQRFSAIINELYFDVKLETTEVAKTIDTAFYKFAHCKA